MTLLRNGPGEPCWGTGLVSFKFWPRIRRSCTPTQGGWSTPCIFGWSGQQQFFPLPLCLSGLAGIGPTRFLKVCRQAIKNVHFHLSGQQHFFHPPLCLSCLAGIGPTRFLKVCQQAIKNVHFDLSGQQHFFHFPFAYPVWRV